MREIGKIKILQIQMGSLKQGKRPESYYDPKYIRSVPSLLLTPDGALGVTADAEKIVDIHNARHPESATMARTRLRLASHRTTQRCVTNSART
jgi:hypothetical protein